MTSLRASRSPGSGLEGILAMRSSPPRRKLKEPVLENVADSEDFRSKEKRGEHPVVVVYRRTRRRQSGSAV